MTAFWVINALLAAGALLFVLPPLLGRRARAQASRRDTNLAIYRDQLRELDADLAASTLSAEQHEKARRELEARLLEDVAVEEAATALVPHGRGAAMLVSVAAPLLAFALYFAVGNPQALLPGPAAGLAAHGMTAQQVEVLVERLAARMGENPEDPEGWILLGRTYGALGRFPQSAQAYANAVARLPRNAGLLADYADALAMTQGRRLQGEPEKIIARALEADPDNLKALALAGSTAFEKKDYAVAVRYWERILPLVPPDSESARTIQASVAEARSLGGAVRAEPPKSLGDLKLLHALQGKEALREINRLHGKEIGGKNGYVAHYFYQRDSRVLWLAVDAPVAKQTLAALLERP